MSKNVVISGSLDANGDMPTIEGGEWPFLVDAVDARVTIQGLHFVRPRAGAIWIYAVSGLVITGCRIESIVPSAEFGSEAGQADSVSTAIFVGADPHPPAQPNWGNRRISPEPWQSSTMTSTWAGRPTPRPWALPCSASGDPRITKWTYTFPGTISGTSLSLRSIFVSSAGERTRSGT